MIRGARRLLGELREGTGIAFFALASNRLRTLLTTLGIVIGVMTVIAIVAIIQGLNASFATSLSGFGASTLYVSKMSFVHSQDDWFSFRNRKALGRKELEAIEQESTLARWVDPQIHSRTSVSGDGKELGNVEVTGTGAQYPQANGVNIQAGRFLADGEAQLARAVAVLGADVADQVFPKADFEDVVGRRIRLGGRSFTVVGVLERRGRFLGMSMDTKVVIPYTTFLQLYGAKRSMTIAVVGDPEKLGQLEDELTGILRRVRQVPPGKDDDFAINRQEQILKVYKQLTGALYGVAIAVGLITLIVGGIGIMNIMLVSVHERTREIGLRRALGARKRTILMQFLLESLTVSAAGGLMGTGLGLGAAQLVALVSPLAAAATPSAIALGVAFSATVGLAFGIWPAWRAANLDPVEALRWE